MIQFDLFDGTDRQTAQKDRRRRVQTRSIIELNRQWVTLVPDVSHVAKSNDQSRTDRDRDDHEKPDSKLKLPFRGHSFFPAIRWQSTQVLATEMGSFH